jgi:uncharacterized membrane protein
MLRVERDIQIARRVEDVFAFVADFDNFTAWSTDVVKAELLTPGPTRVGTKARITRTALGQPFVMDFDLVTYEPNRAIGFRGSMLSVPFASRMDFAPLNGAGAGVKVVQSGEVTVPPLLFMVEPTARQVLGTTFENDLRKLKQLMEAGQDA